MLTTIQRSKLPIVLAFSGGKDSIAMVLYLLENGIEPERIHLHHHEVDGHGQELFDWGCTRDYCIAFAEHFGLQLFFSYREGGILREMMRENQSRGDVYYQISPQGDYQVAPSNKSKVNTRLMWPAVSADLTTRWCSGTVKIDILRTVIAHSEQYQKGCFVLTGERWAESTARSKYLPVEVHATSTTKRPVLWWKPILTWSEQDVWTLIKKSGILPHPAYYLGWSRCSCMTCIFNSPNIWATINNIDPQRVGEISLIEQQINHTLYNKLTIHDKVKQGTVMPTDWYWTDQSRNFTANIYVGAKWQLPKGAFSMEKSGSV